MDLTPVQIGSRTNIWLICEYSDGSEAPALAVNWTLPANVFFVSDYNPTTPSANWVAPVTGNQRSDLAGPLDRRRPVGAEFADQRDPRRSRRRPRI